MPNRLIHAQPIRPVGGPVLRRALRAAFNRVPGRVGRYDVELVGEIGSLLSERLASGRAPLMVIVRGWVLFPSPNDVYSAFDGERLLGPPSSEDIQNGWPFTRIAAICKFIFTDPETLGIVNWTGLNWNQTRRYAYLQNGLNVNDSVIALHPRRSSSIGFSLNPDFASTFCGTRGPEQEYQRLYDVSEHLSSYYIATREGRNGLQHWNRALRVGCADGAGAPDGALASIGTGPQIWNSESDPGGDGDPAGSNNRDPDDDDSEGSDDEGLYPIYAPPVAVIPDPDLIGSGYRAWNSGRLNVPTRRRAPRAGLRISVRPRAEQNPPEIAGCSHCREAVNMSPEDYCTGCVGEGHCVSCGGPYPAPVQDPALSPEPDPRAQYRADYARAYAATIDAALRDAYRIEVDIDTSS